MTDYNLYRQTIGISSLDMVTALRPYYPSITKQIISVVNSPELYGCCLLPEAEDKLVLAYGEGPGLTHPIRRRLRNLFGKRNEHRKKCHRITFWMSPDLYFRLLSLKTKEPYGTFQAIVEAALVQFIDRERQKKAEVIPVDAVP